MSSLFLHLFLPHDSNNYKARLISPIGLFLFLLIFVFSQWSVYFTNLVGVKVLGYAANISPKEVIALTNKERENIGLAPLSYSETLSKAAMDKGLDMLSQGYWAHVAPDGTEPWDFFDAHGYEYRYAGENLARDFADPSSAVSAWMASPTHKENIVSSKYKEIGVAVVEGDLNGVDTTIVVQLFGTPATASASIPVAAASQGSAPETFVSLGSQSTASEEPVIAVSPFNWTRVIAFSLVGFLLLLMIADWFIISRNQVVRVSSRPFAHIAFLGMILVIIGLVVGGQIL